MITFSISGIFKEGQSINNVRPLRSFHRVFVCVPDTVSQMTIVNEQYIISNITSDQFKTYYSEKEVSSGENHTVLGEPLANTTNLQDPKNDMIQQFSNESGLTLEWSK